MLVNSHLCNMKRVASRNSNPARRVAGTAVFALRGFSWAFGQTADRKAGGPRYFCLGRSKTSTATVASNGMVAAAKNAG